MKVDNIKLGIAIKELRVLRKFTQEKLANEVGVTINYLSLVENGKRGISLPNLNKLAESLEIPVAFMIFLGSNELNENNDANKLMKKIKNMIKISVEMA